MLVIENVIIDNHVSSQLTSLSEDCVNNFLNLCVKVGFIINLCMCFYSTELYLNDLRALKLCLLNIFALKRRREQVPEILFH